ncbi:LamG-like jellyroll fold domain-containing protein [Cellulomonas sp. NPDC055163]
MLVVTGALLASSAAAASPGAATAGSGAGHAGRNHAPAAPEALGTANPTSSCSADGTAVPLRSTTPTLLATLKDPDGDPVRATFTVRDGVRGTRVWDSGPAPAQASGSQHAVAVPAGLLQDGRTYEWRVQGRDSRGKKSPTIRCRVLVDVTAPVAPRVSAVPGAAPAAYLEEQTHGGPGVAGQFRFEAGASTDVVAFAYAFSDDPGDRVAVDPGQTAATVTYTPMTPGPQLLRVQGVDAAGNVGAERAYRFTVGSPAAGPTGDARWTLDEGAGAVAADSLHPGTNTLTLTGSTTWADGLVAELANRPADRALLLDERGDGAVSSASVVDPSGSFSVVALVRGDALGAAASAVGQDGAAGNAFELGVRTDVCADGVASCWAFTVAGTDPGDPAARGVVATSPVPVAEGAWFMLAGVHDADLGTVRLDVCGFGRAGAPTTARPVRGASVPVGETTAPAGPFRVGSAPDDTRAWVGAVSGVRTYGKAVSELEERLVCSAGA